MGGLIEVAGGSAGVSARYEDLLALAADYRRTSADLAAAAIGSRGVVTDTDLLASAPLSPESFAVAEASVLAAAAALVENALHWQLDALAIQGAVLALREADEAVRLTMTGLLPDIPLSAGLLALLYPDGDPVVTRRHDLARPATPPGSVRDLIDHLADVDRRGDGVIEVESLPGRRHIVYLPGTDDLTTTPWSADDDVRDLGTDLTVMSGQRDAYQRGILAAMHAAGIGAGEPVLLVGHSLGGIEAAALLAVGGAGFAITHAVTAGSPVGHIRSYPAGSHILSLENRGDVIPQTDGAGNDESREHVTVTFDGGGSGLTGHHGLTAYAEGATAVDTSTDPSVVEQVESLQEFLDAPASTSQVFEIARDGGPDVRAPALGPTGRWGLRSGDARSR